MGNKFIIWGVIFIISLMFVNGQGNLPEFPPLPTGYWGYLTQEGQAVEGLLVVVKDSNNVTVGTANDITNSEGLYSLEVIWENTGLEGDQGVEAGETIYFYASGELLSEQVVGSQGENIRLDMEVPVFENNQNSYSGTSNGNNTNIINSSNDEELEADLEEEPSASDYLENDESASASDGSENDESVYDAETEDDTSFFKSTVFIIIVGVLALLIIFIIIKKIKK